MVNFKEDEALNTLNHSCAHLMAQAIRHLYPQAKFWVGPVVAEGFYYDVDFGDHVFKEEDLAAIEKEMKKIAKRGFKIIRKEISKEEALEMFKDDEYKLDLISNLEDGNITGTSDYLDTTAVMDLLFAADEEADHIALLYDQGQDSSTTAIEEAKKYLDDKGVDYTEYTGTTVDEVMLAADSIIADGADAVFTPSDNTIMTAELSIYEELAEAGIPHYAGADSFALNGAFCGYGVDYINLGVETANMINSILVDGEEPAKTPVMTFDNGIATINTEVCDQLGYDFDEISKTFEPLCTAVKGIETAEEFEEESESETETEEESTEAQEK